MPLLLGVTDLVPVGEMVTVLEAVGETVAEREGVGEGVSVVVPDWEAPVDQEGVGLGVGEDENSSTPCTYRGAAYIVPEFAVAFQTRVLMEKGAFPVHTSVSARRPKFTPVFAGDGG